MMQRESLTEVTNVWRYKNV